MLSSGPSHGGKAGGDQGYSMYVDRWGKTRYGFAGQAIVALSVCSPSSWSLIVVRDCATLQFHSKL